MGTMLSSYYEPNFTHWNFMLVAVTQCNHWATKGLRYVIFMTEIDCKQVHHQNQFEKKESWRNLIKARCSSPGMQRCVSHWLYSTVRRPEYQHEADEDDGGSSKIQTIAWVFAFSLLRLPDGLQFTEEEKKKVSGNVHSLCSLELYM